MQIFDKYLTDIKNLLDGSPSNRFSYDQNDTVEVLQNPEFIMQKDSHAELGGGGLPSLGLTLTCEVEGVQNQIILIGKDIPDLKGNLPYVRLTIIKTKSIEGGEQAQYDAIKRLEYLKYNVNVKGFMSRASSLNQREEVRVSKKAVKVGLTFAKVGNTLIREYLKNDLIDKVTQIFITLPLTNFDQLKTLATKIVNTQNALNHVLDNVNIDCRSCNLKAICDEVEGLREMHLTAIKGKKA